jgi:hypothetical protein
MHSFLIWLHLVGIACGGAAAFGHPAVGLLRARHPSAGAVLGKVAEALGNVGVAGLVLLVVSGAGLVWLAHDLGQMPVAFWVKMGLVVGLVANIIAAKVSAAKADAGDVAAAARMPLLTMTSAALMLTILAAAVLSFA